MLRLGVRPASVGTLPDRSQIAPTLTSALILLACIWTHISPPPAFANGRVVEFERRLAGKYEIALGKIPATPIVGNLHLTMTITDTTASTPVMGAKVLVSAIGPPSVEGADPSMDISPTAAEPDPNDPIYYDVAVNVDRPGVWQFTIQVEADGAEPSTAEFPVEVSTPNPITGIVTLLALVVFIAVIALAVRVYIRERRRSKLSER